MSSNIQRALELLLAERARIDAAIASLERLATSPAAALDSRRRGRKSMGAAERRQVSERMRKYWSDRRATAAGAKHGQR